MWRRSCAVCILLACAFTSAGAAGFVTSQIEPGTQNSGAGRAHARNSEGELAQHAASRGLLEADTALEADATCTAVNSCSSLQNTLSQLKKNVAELQMLVKGGGGSPTPVPTAYIPSQEDVGYCATAKGRASKYCTALRRYLASCRVRFGAKVLRCNLSGATACVSSNYRIVNKSSKNACVRVRTPRPTPKAPTRTPTRTPTRKPTSKLTPKAPTRTPTRKPTSKQVFFCGTSVSDYLITQPDLLLTLTLAFGPKLSAIFGTSSTERVVLFAPTNNAWAAATQTLGIDLPSWRAGKISSGDASILISLLVYNTVKINKSSVDPDVGQISTLLKAESLQSLLGDVLELDLPLSFTKVGTAAWVGGTVEEKQSVLRTPYKLCAGPWSIIYHTDVVLLPSTDRSIIPIAKGFT